MKKAAFTIRTGLFFLTMLFLPLTGRATENMSQTLLTPTSGWLVGPAMPVADSSEASGTPCLAVTQYDNGYNVRISVGEKIIYALAFDFRHDLLKTGKTYPLRLAIEPDFSGAFQGQAYNSHTLLINTQQAENFYEALSSGAVLSLEMADQSLEFSLLSLPDGLQRAASCAQADEVPGKKISDAKNTGEYYANDLTANPHNRADRIENIPVNAVGHGEAIHKTEDIVVNYKAMGISSGPPQQERSEKETGSPEAAENVRQWRALRGSNLREVLDVWSQVAGVNLLWRSDQEFAIPETFSIKGSYETAVLALLEQYNLEKIRPVGKIYQNQAAAPGKRTLLIASETSD